MGRLLAIAVQNEDAGVSMDDISNIAELVSMVADCIETTNELTFESKEELYKREVV
jgi:hypothetical protein